MSSSPLSTLKPTLMAIEAASVRRSTVPMAVALQEANDLAVFVAGSEIRKGLLRVGLEEAVIEALPEAVAAAREAQSEWVVARDANKGDGKAERIEQGEALRSDIAAACRWNLRKDRAGLAVVSAVMEGDGIEDLIQDLNDLAELVDRKRSAFTADKTFKATVKAEEARSLAAELTALTSAERNAPASPEAKDLRDRAYTHLDDLVRQVREAGRYAFGDEPEAYGRFVSDYLRRRRARAKKASAEAQAAGVADEEGEGAS
jgi:hypothetical protein